MLGPAPADAGNGPTRNIAQQGDGAVQRLRGMAVQTEEGRGVLERLGLFRFAVYVTACRRHGALSWHVV